jgi:hypothetical protein
VLYKFTINKLLLGFVLANIMVSSNAQAFTWGKSTLDIQNKAWEEGFDCARGIYGGFDDWKIFAKIMVAYGVGGIILIQHGIINDLNNEKAQAKKALVIYKLIEDKLRELKNITTGELAIEQSSLYRLDTDMVVKEIFLSSCAYERILYGQVKDVLEVMKLIAQQLGQSLNADISTQKRDLYKQVKSIYKAVNENLLKANTKLNDQINLMLSLDADLLQFLLAY